MRRTALGLLIDFADLSDPGRDPAKQLNEDACGFAETQLGLLGVVCDGMGGHTGGREASRTAVRVVLEQCQTAPTRDTPDLTLRAAIQAAGREVFALGGYAPDAARPGSTCVAALLHPGGATVAHAGDSRAMLVRSGHLTRLTRDHSMVREMVDAGILSETEAATHPDANKITRALGIAPEVEVEVQQAPVELRPGDVLLLTSDGITDLVSDSDLLAVIDELLPRGPAAVCHRVIQLANSRGGHDNLTLQVLHVLEVPTARPPVGRADTVLLDDTEADGGAGPGTERLPEALDGDARPLQPTMPDRPGPAPTVVDPKTAPGGTGTLIQDPAPATERQFVPTVAGSEPRPPSTLSGRVRRRIRFAVIGLGLFVVLGLMLAWWGRHGRDRQVESQPPPPAPEPTAVTPTTAPLHLSVELVPEEPTPPPEPVPRPAPDPPDASIDAAPGAPASESSAGFP